MSLQKAFVSSRNLGDLTSAWVNDLGKRMASAGVTTMVKLPVQDAVSLVAPGALIASVIAAGGSDLAACQRVLLIGKDPMFRLDHGTWASEAGKFIGRPVTVYLTTEEEAISSLYPVAQGLGLPKCSILSEADVLGSDSLPIDLAIWVHPANEVSTDDEVAHRRLAKRTLELGIPTFACVFNEPDLAAQKLLLTRHGISISPLSGEIKRGSASVNRFGIAGGAVGLEGGWGAILARLGAAPPTEPSLDEETVRAALGLLRLTGALGGDWGTNVKIQNIDHHRMTSVSLMGSLAVSIEKGYVLSPPAEGARLELIGQLWSSALVLRPTELEPFLVWASKIMLSFMTRLPMEPAKSEEALAILRTAAQCGITEAMVALARVLEASMAPAAREEAWELYRRAGTSHPLSAYACAHAEYERGNFPAALELFTASEAFGYAPAITDKTKLLVELGHPASETTPRFMVAAKCGDVEAMMVCGELFCAAGDLQAAGAHLEQAAHLGHTGAIQLAATVAQAMLEHGFPQRSKIKRYLAGLRKKIDSFAPAPASANARK